MNATKHFNKLYYQQTPYLMRHFKSSMRRRIAKWILGTKAIENILFDAAQVGWGIGSNYERFESTKPMTKEQVESET